MKTADRTLRVLGFEPFDAGSHKAVRESISRHSRHHWTWITRPGRAWKWRMRLAALEMVDQAAGEGALHESVDLIFATSLMSVADLRAHLPAAFRATPIVLYMHENQAAYPQETIPQGPAQHDVQFALTNLTSVLAADLVIWNSRWNLQSFIDGVQSTLNHATDLTLVNVKDRVMQRSQVIWPPVEFPTSARILHNSAGALGKNVSSVRQREHREVDGQGRPVVRVVWPHRWEHDKGPDELLAIAAKHSEPLNIRWTILGEQYRERPRAMNEFCRQFAGRIDHFGFELDRVKYLQHLALCDWVLSTARHEFFGIAVVEALLSSCLPWLPNALSYPELLPDKAHSLNPFDTPNANDMPAIRNAIIEHLQPALAANAVARIDQTLEQTAALALPTPPLQIQSPIMHVM